MRALLHFLARPILFFYALPWLMVLLVLGTLAQRTDGLYVAEQKFFASAVLWLGPLPLPGGLTILVLIALNLLTKLLLQRGWTGRKLGTSITHVSVLLLLLGGGVTLALREEGFIELAPGSQGALVTDYHARELVVLENGQPLRQTPFEELTVGQTLAELPFGLRIDSLCRHCTPLAVTPPATDRHGVAQTLQLQNAALLPQDEDNLAGVTFTLSGLDAAQDGVYVAFTPLKEMPEVKQGDKTYRILLRRAERPLPFSLTLQAFHKTEHPGTRIAKAYRSDVLVTDGAAQWPVTISMNEPLRYRGYTVYQSSFIERPEATSSVLTVVRDQGQAFPYLAVAALCTGMLIHLFGLWRRRKEPA